MPGDATRIWLEAARPRTLPAAVAAVAVGSALAWHNAGFNVTAAVLGLAFALLVQIAANLSNDFYLLVPGADTGGGVRGAVMASRPAVEGPMGRRLSDAVRFVPEGIAVLRVLAVGIQSRLATAYADLAWPLGTGGGPFGVGCGPGLEQRVSPVTRRQVGGFPWLL